MQGQIYKVIAGFYDIYANDKIYRVRGSGNLRNKEQSPVVGDYVIFEPEGFVTEILERKNSLVRPKVANIDQAIIVQSYVQPNYSSILLNKFLAIIEANNIKPIIVFTKSDLTKESRLQEYLDQGYTAYEISNNDLKSLDLLKKVFKNKLSVFTGQTGAGKSSTINSLANTKLATQEISKSLNRGKHTTRVVEIISWLGGRLVDTPGFSSLEFNLSKLDLARSYHDFKKHSQYCQFPRTCLHDKEIDCGIKKAVNNNKITKQRYNDYLKILREIK